MQSILDDNISYKRLDDIGTHSTEFQYIPYHRPKKEKKVYNTT